MMRPSGLSVSAVLMLSCCCFSLLAVRGHIECNARKFMTRINVTTELKSGVLLPCLFDPVLSQFNLSTDSGVVWSHINPTVGTEVFSPPDIVDISLNGQQSFWGSRNGRIKAFKDAPAFGNFSIQIADVQSSDLGLYRCELYRKTNCFLAYYEISLSLAEFSWFSNWWVIAAGAGGGFLLLCLITVCVYCTRTKKTDQMKAGRDSVGQMVNASSDHEPQNCHDTNEETVGLTYASVVYIKTHSCNDSKGQTSDEINYASVTYKSRSHETEVISQTPINVSESEPVSPETVLYAAVRQKERR